MPQYVGALSKARWNRFIYLCNGAFSFARYVFVFLSVGDGIAEDSGDFGFGEGESGAGGMPEIA